MPVCLSFWVCFLIEDGIFVLFYILNCLYFICIFKYNISESYYLDTEFLNVGKIFSVSFIWFDRVIHANITYEQTLT